MLHLLMLDRGKLFDGQHSLVAPSSMMVLLQFSQRLQSDIAPSRRVQGRAPAHPFVQMIGNLWPLLAKPLHMLNVDTE
jgi:hypothetical protein